MRRIHLTTLLSLAVCVGVVTWVALDLILRHRGWVPGLSLWVVAVAVVVSVLVLVAGVAVRRLRAHEPTWMTPTGAAATAAAAQASAIVGAVMCGGYAGNLALALLAQRHGSSPDMTELAWRSGVGLATCLVWAGVGMLVEHWCAIDASDGDDDAARPGPDGHEAQAGAAARSRRD